MSEFNVRREELRDLRDLVAILGGRDAQSAVRTYTLTLLIRDVQHAS